MVVVSVLLSQATSAKPNILSSTGRDDVVKARESVNMGGASWQAEGDPEKMLLGAIPQLPAAQQVLFEDCRLQTASDLELFHLILLFLLRLAALSAVLWPCGTLCYIQCRTRLEQTIFLHHILESFMWGYHRNEEMIIILSESQSLGMF